MFRRRGVAGGSALVLASVSALAFSVAQPAPASDLTDCEGPVTTPQTFTLEWNKRDWENQYCAGLRLQDQYSNPAFHAKLASASPALYGAAVASQLAEPTRPRATSHLVPGTTAPDPFRIKSEWAAPVTGRGRVTDVSFIASGTGAKLVGELWRPPASVPGPYPGVIIVTGGSYQFRHLYHWAAQGLAEAGYMVLSYDSQGQGGSESFNHTDDGGSFCTSRGCPGGPMPTDHFYGTYGVYTAAALRDAIKFITSTPSNPYTTAYPNTAGTNLFNPVHPDLDRRVLDASGRTPLGIAGHSLGGASAMIQGQLDPRVSAIVSWDASISLPSTPSQDALGSAHAPTLTLKADYNDFPTWNMAPPNPSQHFAGYEQLRNLCRQGKQCLDVMQVSLRAATHWEWTYVPYARPASRYGERVSFYYTRAWFDTYLKGAIDPVTRSAGLARLRATTFDGSADASSIGAGRGAIQGGAPVNQPYLIAGKAVADRLSFYFRTSYYLTSGSTVYECLNVRAGC